MQEKSFPSVSVMKLLTLLKRLPHTKFNPKAFETKDYDNMNASTYRTKVTKFQGAQRSKVFAFFSEQNLRKVTRVRQEVVKEDAAQ